MAKKRNLDWKAIPIYATEVNALVGLDIPRPQDAIDFMNDKNNKYVVSERSLIKTLYI